MGPNGRRHRAPKMELLDKRFVYRLMMPTPIESTGFKAPYARPLGTERRSVAFAELVAIIGLALSTIVAATVVSVGIARADVASDVVGNEGSLFGVALVLGLIFVAMGGLTMISLPGEKAKKH
jgi:hypothetical protein